MRGAFLRIAFLVKKDNRKVTEMTEKLDGNLVIRMRNTTQLEILKFLEKNPELQNIQFSKACFREGNNPSPTVRSVVIGHIQAEASVGLSACESPSRR